jgi:hypothetical protein
MIRAHSKIRCDVPDPDLDIGHSPGMIITGVIKPRPDDVCQRE